MQQDRKSRGHNIQCLFAAVCQLEPALLTVKEIRAQAQAVYRKAIAGKSRSTFWKVLCVCGCVWWADWSMLSFYFCHPFLSCDSCCLEMMTNAVRNTLVPRIPIPPLACRCACVCVCMLKRADMVGDRICLVGRYTCLSVWERSKFPPSLLINPTHMCHPLLSCSRFRHTIKPSWAPLEYIKCYKLKSELSNYLNCFFNVILLRSFETFFSPHRLSENMVQKLSLGWNPFKGPFRY